jgi:hypothetical protein
MRAKLFFGKLGLRQLATATLLFSLLCGAGPAFAQHSVHVETTVTNITDSNFANGPASG